MKIFLHKKAVEFLRKLDKSVSEKIKKKITQLKKNPNLGKNLKYTKFKKLRCGDYRIIYEIIQNKIIILFIGHRKDVYDDFKKLF